MIEEIHLGSPYVEPRYIWHWRLIGGQETIKCPHVLGGGKDSDQTLSNGSKATIAGEALLHPWQFHRYSLKIVCYYNDERMLNCTLPGMSFLYPRTSWVNTISENKNVYLPDINSETQADIASREILTVLKLQLYLFARKLKQLCKTSHSY